MIVDIANDCEMRTALLELAQDVAKRIVWPNEMSTTTENGNEISNGRFILRIDKDEILGKENSNDVIAVNLVDWNSIEYPVLNMVGNAPQSSIVRRH